MGVAFVFIIYVVGLAILTVPAMVVGVALGAFFSRGIYRSLRKRFVIAGALVPILGAGYAVCCIIAMAAFGLLTHRDFGFGDGFELPLRNGYQFSAIDLPNIATLYRRGDAIVADSSSEQIGRSAGPTVSNVFALQESGEWLYGSRATNNPRFADDKRIPDRWFLLNTRTLHLKEVDSQQAFLTLLADQHLDPTLLDSEVFYGSRRYRWYDLLAIVVLLIPPAIGTWILWKVVRRMRRKAATTTEPVEFSACSARPAFLREPN